MRQEKKTSGMVVHQTKEVMVQSYHVSVKGEFWYFCMVVSSSSLIQKVKIS